MPLTPTGDDLSRSLYAVRLIKRVLISPHSSANNVVHHRSTTTKPQAPKSVTHNARYDISLLRLVPSMVHVERFVVAAAAAKVIEV